MKSIILSMICFIISIVLLVIINKFRNNRPKQEMFFPIVTTLVTMPLYICIYYFTPKNLYLIPDKLLEDIIWVDFINGLCLFILLCVGFIDFLIAAVTQPFTTDILVIIGRGKEKGMTYKNILNAYSDSSGIKHIFNKRFDYLLNSGYITKNNKVIALTNKGRNVTKLVKFLKLAS